MDSVVNQSNDEALDINSLPNEIILQVFGYLKQNQLGQIARVCRRWNALTKSPGLWKEVNVKFLASHLSQTTVATSFINRLPSCVTSIRIDFMESRSWTEPLHFVELCVRLQEKCPDIKTLILIKAEISDNLPAVIDSCTHFLPAVKNLVFHHSRFFCSVVRGEFCGTSKLEVLDLSWCYVRCLNGPQFFKMPNLKKLCLYGADVDDTWFLHDTLFLNQLHVLNVGLTQITASIFRAIQNDGLNLKELYLCSVNLGDHYLNFNNSFFPHLKTICLSGSYVTFGNILHLIQSCPSLQNVYVNESFAVLPFVVASRYKSEIVKLIRVIHIHEVDYLHN